MNRLASLDYLRGLAAFGIMYYHYVLWTMGDPGTGSFLGRVGIYGVAVFYILSGITLYHVYYYKIGNPSKKGLTDFAINRVFRIFPLLWLMTAATLLIKKEYFPTEIIVLNFTGLFGLYHWGDTVCYGAWSIGNELVFYLFFPVFIFLSKKSVPLFTMFSVVLLCIFLWFTFEVMDSSKPLSADYWIKFINPLNQVSLFLGGYLIGHFSRNKSISWHITLPVITFCVLAFIYYPVHGDIMLLISGFNRIVFTVICLALCFAVYKTNSRLLQPFHWFFSMLGEISYSVYLSHPLTAYIFPRLIRNYFPGLKTLPAIAGFSFTIIISYIVYHLYEKTFMKSGKYIAGKVTSSPNAV